MCIFVSASIFSLHLYLYLHNTYVYIYRSCIYVYIYAKITTDLILRSGALDGAPGTTEAPKPMLGSSRPMCAASAARVVSWQDLLIIGSYKGALKNTRSETRVFKGY